MSKRRSAASLADPLLPQAGGASRVAGAAAAVIARPALLARLAAARGRRVCLVQAPVGYGKTQLLAAWARQLRHDGVDVAWPALEDDCADPARFFAALIAAIADPAGRAPSAAARPSAKHLAAVLQQRPSPLVIVLDDYDRVSTDELDEAVSGVLQALPPHAHCVVVARANLRIPFGALWADADVAVLSQADLRFSDDEIAEVFGHALSPEDLARVSVWTEGWPAAVQLARHYLATRQDGDLDLPAVLSRAHDDAGRYLLEQVLRRLPERHRELLVQTSFLTELRSDLVEAVTGARQSWMILQDLLASNVLIAPADGAGSWHRCHNLLREVMYAQLRQRGRAELSRLHLAAACWFAAEGRLRDALRHAQSAEDFDFAAKLIQDAGGIFYGVRYGGPALRLLMQHIPPHVANEYPRLCLANAFLLFKEGRCDIGADMLRAVQVRYRDVLADGAPDADPLLVMDVAMADVTAAVYAGLHLDEGAVATLEAAVRDAPRPSVWLRGVVHNLMCIARYRSSDFPGAKAAAEAAHYYYAQASSSNWTGHMHVHKGMADLELADPLAALRSSRAGRAAFESGLCGDEAGCAIADLLAAEALYEQGRLAEARRLCGPAHALVESGESNFELLIGGYRTLVGLARAEGGLPAAMRLLSRAQDAARRRRVPEVERFVALLRLEAQLDSDGGVDASEPMDPDAACARRGRRGVDVQPWREQDLRALLDARLLQRAGDRDGAVAALDRLQERLAAAGRPRSRVRALIHLALACDAGGDRPEALRRLHAAIEVAMPGGAVMPFAEQGRLLAPLLAQIVTAVRDDPDAGDFARRVLRACAETGVSAAPLFSHREQEIVRLLIRGTNNKMIARALDISPDTVRFHLKSIYEKFGVSDRRVVAELARERSLVD